MLQRIRTRPPDSQRAPVIVDSEKRTLDLPHRGLTIRHLQGLAAAGSKPGTRPRWTLIYKGVVIGELRLATIKEPDGN